MPKSIGMANEQSSTFYRHDNFDGCDNHHMIYDGRKIAELRDALGLKQAELARLAGISQPTLWAIEHQMTKKPEADTMIYIAAALGVPIRDLYKKMPGKPDDLESEMADAFRLLDHKDQQAMLAAVQSLVRRSKK